MTLARGLLVLPLALTMMAVSADEATAHHASGDNPNGTLAVAAGGSAGVAVDKTQPGDTLQWTWTVMSGPRAGVSALLVWTDGSGREHEFVPGPVDQPFGTFVAPDGFAGARLVWRNGGPAEAQVHWAYGASAPFWRRPDIFLPALIPVLLLVGCYAAARVIDRRGSRGRAVVAIGSAGAGLTEERDR